jgi:cellulose synthase/poly-beta-1,6-N-acetylglucosamine synthase-like glycosyltransferase/peptidoglycan/xylan/chitin deacetylase (PgdA/CDA1 family)/spore germination protein YaaH
MSQYSYNQIFFDQTKQRWRYAKFSLFALSFVLLIFFGTMFFSMLRQPVFPNANLPIPNSSLRSAPPSVSTNTNLQNAAASTIPLINNQRSVVPPSILKTTPFASTASKTTPQSKMIGFYVNWDDTSFSSLQNNINTLDELIPEWLHLGDENGNISVDDQAIQDKTLNYISKNRSNLPIAPLINNFDQSTQDWNSQMLDKMLNNPDARAQTIQNILDFVTKNKFAGISIDFESVPDTDQPMLAEFMKELYAKFHPMGLEVTQNIPLNDPAFDLKTLSQNSDYLILMAYDEYSVGSDIAGPLASQKWFVDSMNIRLNELPAEKYIVALGNYGYDWDSNTTNGQTYTFQDSILSAKDAGSQIVLNQNSLNPTYNYFDGDVLHHVWFLDATTVFNEISALKNVSVHGYALWRMGSEDPSVWNVFSGRNDLNTDTAKSLLSLGYGYDIDYEGHGEILRVTGTPAKGARDLTFDQRTGLITKETITKYPSSYTIYRWGSSDPKKIALTFDDGPDPAYTPRILSILKQYNAKATFFIVGANGTKNQSLLEQTAVDGNEIGNHTFTHPNITNVSDSQFSFELNSTESLLASATGRHTLLFRPPYAEDVEPVTPEEIRSVLFATNKGYYTVGMHIDPSDWSSPGVDEIVNRVIDGAIGGNGNIVLLHDGGGDRSQTIAALPKIIEGLRAKGFDIVTISELMGVAQDSVMPPVSSDARVMSKISEGGFLATDWGTSFLYNFFIIGIILGILRFFFIAILAIAQKIRRHFEKFPDYIDKFKPSVAVIIPAFNEEKVIRRTVDAVLRSNYSNFEIILVDDGSMDSTLNVMQYFFSENPKVRIYSKSNAGKWSALNFGIEKTRAQVLVTLDADTIFRSSTIEKLIPYFSDLRVGAVAGNTKVGNRHNTLTRWQALEYITSQNLDRRAFDVMNCITVVPGSVGAWRRKAVLEAGGFSDRTLAEDADLTLSIIRLGYKVTYQERAVAYTEAPETIKDFLRQRFRWMLGTLQAAWKHADALFRPRYGALGIIALPNIFVFQIIFTLISPLMDLTILGSLTWALWQSAHHPVDYSAFFAVQKLVKYYLFFLAVDFLTSATAFALEKNEDWKLLFWLVPQRFFYRQLMYFVAFKVFFSALKGKIVGWGKLHRRATVSMETS